jgi:hypothetical protein
VANTTINYTLPFTPSTLYGTPSVVLVDNSVNVMDQGEYAGGNVCAIQRYDSGNWTLMAGEQIRANGSSII